MASAPFAQPAPANSKEPTVKSPIALVQFLQELEQNNHRDWFEANRTRY
ncbi:MAG: DUF2461 family protein, partial [Caldilineaceae bacterium]